MAKQADTRTPPVRGSRTGRPIMALLDLLGRRWSLRILWELRGGPLTSRALRTACDEASPTVLQARLTELREAGFVELGEGGGYGLTALGQDLCEMVMPLHRFAERWKSSSPSPRLRGEGRGEGKPPRRR
ncbi:winged helix-turn-helix transcriptional regulator [Bradyrhizobium japonicum]|uniref:winged helix-turn-helix transcriptional regulator n=1 Tax=Bradyrhizobium japonicum TaxID=375 RepID=UPI00067629FF|nr:helix-turn-helix domain-containing protein [Bradyrhizobium japonicum]